MEDKKNKKILESLPDSFKFELSSPVSYAFNGERVRQDSLDICCPSMAILFDTFEFRQMLAQACMSSTAFMSKIQAAREELKSLSGDQSDDEKTEDKESDESPAGQTGFIEAAILFSTGEHRMKMPYAIRLFRDLCLLGCVKVHGKPLDLFQWNELMPNDQFEMLLQFAGVFILPLIFPKPDKVEKTQEGL